MVPGGKDIGEGQQGGQQLLVHSCRDLDQGAVRLGNPNGLPLPAVHVAENPAATVPAGGLQATPAVVASVVRPYERRDYQVALVEGGHVRTDLLHHPKEFVTDPPAALGGLPVLVRP